MPPTASAISTTQSSTTRIQHTVWHVWVFFSRVFVFTLHPPASCRDQGHRQYIMFSCRRGIILNVPVSQPAEVPSHLLASQRPGSRIKPCSGLLISSKCTIFSPFLPWTYQTTLLWGLRSVFYAVGIALNSLRRSGCFPIASGPLTIFPY